MNNRPCVAYVCADPGVPVFGHKGCSVHVQEIVRGFTRQGFPVKLFAASLDGYASRPSLEVEAHPLLAVLSNQCVSELEITAVNEAIEQALAQCEPFAFVYERFSLWSYAGMTYARKANVPGILEVNAPLIDEQIRHRRPIDRTAAERVAEKVFRAAEHLIAVSPTVGDYLEGYPGARGRVHVVPNGVDPERFRPGLKSIDPKDNGSFTVGFVGSMKPWHGLGVLIRAFEVLYRRDPETRLLLVGDGPVRKTLEEDLDSRGLLPAAHFAGAAPPAEIPYRLASMDVAVAPYPDLKPFYFSPLKIYEYMAAGLPVVASRVPPLEHLIQDGINGLLVPPEDWSALAGALERLRENRQLRRRLGEAARATILQEHTWDQVIEKVLNLARLCPHRPERREALGR